MNAIKNIYAVLALIALCLSSCEMKNELEGKYNLKNDEGLLTLDLQKYEKKKIVQIYRTNLLTELFFSINKFSGFDTELLLETFGKIRWIIKTYHIANLIDPVFIL